MEVADCTWTALDVARWKVLTVDLAGEDSFDKFGERVRRAMGDALQDADDRLLAVRIILTGATSLHGMLASRTDRYEAEIEGYAQDFGEGRVWIEQIRLQTRSIVSLEELALQDALTRVVVESIAEAKADPGKLPDELDAALALLPQEMALSMRESWTGTGWEKLAEDSCSMILERLTEKAGKS
jgi:DNA repair protein SbcD/Mre11